MKKIIKNLFFLILVFLSFPLLSKPIWAGSLGFDKTSATAANGETFQIAVTVDPGSDGINSTDAYISYDASLLKATAVSAGALFPTVSNDLSTSGTVYIAGMVDDPASSISTAGTLATITFQGLKDGTGTLSFDCATSKIIKNDINASNVIVCSANGTSAVTIGSGGTAPTSAPVSELPQSGVFDNVVKLVIPGIILLLLGSIFRLVL